ncbi:MAG: hypothetical protein EOO15_14100 [Chitinophagaceae bacterium]|nr:MAG: hypothetical protein EOO15_14100 [Chitinophagaceae bacterium]
MKISFRWPLDSATTIALVALFLSAIQLVATAPVLTAFYVSPTLVVEGQGSNPKSDVLFGTYTVRNKGNAPATKIEIGFTLQADQRISIVPNINATIVEEKNPTLIKNVRIEVERLVQGEQFIIMVFPGPSNQKLDSQVADFFLKNGTKEVPSFSFIRSAEGMGTFAHTSERKK